jgi:hypothetical protein
MTRQLPGLLFFIGIDRFKHRSYSIIQDLKKVLIAIDEGKTWVIRNSKN